MRARGGAAGGVTGRRGDLRLLVELGQHKFVSRLSFGVLSAPRESHGLLIRLLPWVKTDSLCDEDLKDAREYATPPRRKIGGGGIFRAQRQEHFPSLANCTTSTIGR